MESQNSMTGFTNPASLPLRDAVDAVKEDANRPLCEVCGTRPRERRRRRDGSWYRYAACRRCRRLTTGEKPGPARIGDGRLLYLLEILEEYLLKLKVSDWKNAPKRVVLQRLKSLTLVLKE
jgi:hypothetical protein